MTSLPFRKKSSSSWGTLPSACSILMVMLKEKRSLCRSNSPVERWRQGLHFRTEALAWGTPKSKGNDVNSHIAKGLHLTLSASDGHGCPDAKGQSVSGDTCVHLARSHQPESHSLRSGGCATEAGATFSPGSRIEYWDRGMEFTELGVAVE